MLGRGRRGEEAGQGATSHRLRRLLLGGIAALYVLSVPWYRDADAPLRLVFGLPDWVAVALGCYVGVAVLNAWAWWVTDVVDDESDPQGRS